MSKPCEILALKAIIKYLQRRHFRIPRVEYELGLSRVPSKVRTQYATLHMHVRVNSGGGCEDSAKNSPQYEVVCPLSARSIFNQA